MSHDRALARYPVVAYLRSSEVLDDAPLRVVDVGASGGPEAHWELFGDRLELIGFEPNAEECERLNQQARLAARRRETYYPLALHCDKGVRTLHLTQLAQSSSFLQPDPRVVQRFANSVSGTVVGEVEVETTDLDSLMQQHQVRYVDFLKVDVEGVELEVLEGSRGLLSSSIMGLSVETFFQPYRVGEQLFADVDAYLRGLGFMLFDLDLARWRRRPLATADACTWGGAGQVMWGQALYLRDLVGEVLRGEYQPAEADRVRVLKLAGLAEVFGLPDVALELLQQVAPTSALTDADRAFVQALDERYRRLHPAVPPPSVGQRIRAAVRDAFPESWLKATRRLRGLPT